MSDPVAAEVAEDEFLRLCEALDVDLDDMDAEDRETFEDIKKPIVRAIRKGRVVIDDKGQPTVRLKYPVGDVASVTFYRPTGATIMAAGDSRKKNEVEKLMLMMADITKQPTVVFTKMDDVADGKLCRGITRLFLA